MKKLIFCILCIFTLGSTAVAENEIKWQSWNENIFKNAQSDEKLVLLNLEAVWCHWCHVMEKETYSNKDVADIIGKSFLAVKVDQDSYPDLSLRYRDYGWPATIIFNSKGEELQKLSGFQEASKFLEILKKSTANPVPENKKPAAEIQLTSSTTLSKEYKDLLISRHTNSLDTEKGGLKTAHKFLDFDTLEYSLLQAWLGNETEAEFVKLSLNSNLKLIDPAWGGVYQYSTKRSWDNPHYEKIMSSQTDNLTLYSYAFSFWNEPKFLNPAEAIYGYLKNFLRSENGAFYTSQDADLVKGQHSSGYFALSDEERKAKGIPAVDKNIYARENGWVISAFSAVYAATSDKLILEDAIKAAEWIIKNRSIGNGGYKHGESANDGIFLGDSLSMAAAFLDLYSKTGDRKWLTQSQETSDFISANFKSTDSTPGLYAMKSKSSQALKPHKDAEENLQAARHFNLLFHYTGNKKYKTESEQIMKYSVSPAAASNNINNSGLLTADYECSNEPLHITIVGYKDDPASALLFNAGLKYFSVYKRIEWWDKREGAMPNPDVEYPQMPKPAAFICTNKRCSLPIFKPEKISETIKLFYKKD